MGLTVLLLENVWGEMAAITSELVSEIPGTEIWHVRSEYGFRHCLPDLLKEPPDLATLDIAVSWPPGEGRAARS